MNISELVYESLIGELVDSIKDVPNAFEPGSYCESQYRQVLEAYERLRGRLGVADEDPSPPNLAQRRLLLRLAGLHVALGEAVTAHGLILGPDQDIVGLAVDALKYHRTAGIFVVHRVYLLKIRKWSLILS